MQVTDVLKKNQQIQFVVVFHKKTLKRDHNFSALAGVQIPAETTLQSHSKESPMIPGTRQQ